MGFAFPYAKPGFSSFDAARLDYVATSVSLTCNSAQFLWCENGGTKVYEHLNRSTCAFARMYFSSFRIKVYTHACIVIYGSTDGLTELSLGIRRAGGNKHVAAPNPQ